MVFDTEDIRKGREDDWFRHNEAAMIEAARNYTRIVAADEAAQRRAAARGHLPAGLRRRRSRAVMDAASIGLPPKSEEG